VVKAPLGHALLPLGDGICAEQPCCYKSPQPQPSSIHTAAATTPKVVTPWAGLQEDASPCAVSVSIIHALPRGKGFEAWLSLDHRIIKAGKDL